MRLYTYSINVDTLEIESSEEEYEDYDEECTGYAEYEESLGGNRIYAESLYSIADARELTYNYCMRFKKCADKIFPDVVASREATSIGEFA